MKSNVIRNAAALVLGGAVLVWSLPGAAQVVVQQPAPQPPPPQTTVVTPAPAPAPAPQTNVVVSPGVTQAQPPSTTVVTPPAPAAPVADEAIHPETRPNRKLLMTGLVVFGAPYIASMGIAATSQHQGDSNLWIPALGPWVDLGARGGCPSGSTDCGNETGNKALLVADGILQTVGAFEIIGAFIWPETVEVTTVGKADGPLVHFTPGKVGRDGYGMAAVGQF